MDSCRVVTDASAFRATARDALAADAEPDADHVAAHDVEGTVSQGASGRVVRVPVEVRVTVDDPWTAYRRARSKDGDWGVFLETTGVGDASADGDSGGTAGDEWSYFAVDPVETLTARPDAVALGGSDETTGSDGPSPTLAALEGLLDGTTLARGDCDVPYPCGAFGWLSYDIARELEALPADADRDRDLPRLQVGVYDRVAAWRPAGTGDPGKGEGVTLRVTACPVVAPAATVDDGFHSADEETVDSALDTAYDRGVERARALATRALEGDPGHGPPPAPTAEVASFESDAGRAAYAERVRRVKEWIRDGDTFQANVSHRLRAPAAVHPVAVYDALRRVNPAPYSGLLECPGVDLVSASPELLLERDGDRVRTEPIAGTRPRGDTAAADAALETELRGDEKERAEHAMLVDLERNDLGKVSTYGSVDVAEYRRVDRYSEVMHLVSDVTGRLRDGIGTADAVGAVFPGGTITGAPKPRTMAIIDAVEDTRRGPYTGSMAAFGFDDRATCNIVIRTLTRYRDEYHLRVGAGIVHDSDADREYDETLDKARALLTAVDDALESDATMDVEATDA